MCDLLAARSWYGEFVPFTGWSEPAEIEEAAAVQGRVGNPHDTSQAHQRLFIDFVPAHQVGVVTEIPHEPGKRPPRRHYLRAVRDANQGYGVSWCDLL